MNAIFPFYSIGDFLNRPSEKIDFAMVRFEEMEEPNVDEIHKHTFYEILWIEKGATKQTIDFNEYEVLPGSLFFISPGQVHSFDEWEGLQGGTIFFTEEFVLLQNANPQLLYEFSFLDNPHSSPVIHLNSVEFEKFQVLLTLMNAENARSNHSLLVLQSLLKVFLIEIQRQLDQKIKNKIPPKNLILYKKFKSLLEKNVLNHWKSRDYAREIDVSAHHLNFICKQLTDSTTTGLIRERTILEAKRMLIFSEKKVTEIAKILGFTDLAYFGKVFRNVTKMNPLDFKKKFSEKYRINPESS